MQMVVLLLSGCMTLAYANDSSSLAKATFAAGCFWCVEPPFDELNGVISTISGYTGGNKKNPTYEEVSAGGTGHTEAMQVTFDPKLVSYEKLLEVYWKNVDPFDGGGQFCDRGNQYRPGIYYHSEAQKEAAEKSRKKRSSLTKRRIAVEIEQMTEFYPAEDYHQNYYQRNPIRYKFYRYSCGRDKRLRQVAGELGN